MHFDDQGWLDIAKEYDISGNSWDRGGVQPTHLVVHATAGGSNGNDTLAYEASVGVSTHFAVSTNGDIWQGVPCANRAAWGV
jgi:N-acetyl-anhydromuramyl-L-alanine amidase AmpD